MDFWDFAKLVHQSIDDTRVTIITDQAKGLTQSIADVLSLTGHFHCSYHRHQNILKYLSGEALRNTFACDYRSASAYCKTK